MTEGKQLEEGHLDMGVPARKMRPLTDQEKAAIDKNVAGYRARAELYARGLQP